MAWYRPTLPTLLDRGRGDIEGSLSGSDASLRRKNLGALAGLLAVVAHGLYGAIASVARTILPFDAEKEELDRHATFWLDQPRKAAESATGDYVFSGTDGTIVESGAVLVRDDGVEFATDAEATIADGTATVAITALAAGAAGNTEAGASLSLASPIAGIGGGVVAVGGLTQGADTETDDELLPRVLARPKQPPHGGADFDYETWAKEVAGVTRAWCYPLEQGAGTVVVRFVRDNDAEIIPDAGAVNTVQTYIDERRSVTADVYVVAPVIDAVDYVFASLTPNTQANRDGIAAALADLHARESSPGATILLSQTRATISTVPGVIDYVLSSPATDVVNATGHMSVLGDITWP